MGEAFSLDHRGKMPLPPNRNQLPGKDSTEERLAPLITNKTFAEIQIGVSARMQRTLTKQDIDGFGLLSGDMNPTHFSDEYAQMLLERHKLVGHSMWGGALISSLLGNDLPGPGTVYQSQQFEFHHAVELGDVLTVTVTATDITSLFLHANVGHLAGNIIGIAVFGTAVCRVAGWGLGFMVILLSGGVGNLMNAFLYTEGHLSIGASTSVFGSIGYLSGFSFLDKSRRTGGRRQALLPIGGGLALLDFLGSGEHADVMAHFWGFSAGILFAALNWVLGSFLKKKGFQMMCTVLTLAIIGFSWLQGFF